MAGALKCKTCKNELPFLLRVVGNGLCSTCIAKKKLKELKDGK